MPFKNYKDKNFNRWTVISFDKRLGVNTYWICQCSCKNKTIKSVCIGHLVSGKSKSCGCLAKELLKDRAIHNATLTPEYAVRKAIIQRCLNPKCEAYKNYGARGIFICNRWRFGENGLTGFECFLEDMGKRPNKYYSIDRINNNDGYYKENCRWTTRLIQNRNKRNSKNKI